MYYVKHRPQTFSDIQKPNEVAQNLMNQLKNQRTAHAYLFAGPKGVGKTTMARLLAKGLNCLNLTQDGDVCGVCEFCVGVQNGSLMDILEIDAASSRGIDDIRDLREKARLMPARAKKKVYIIDEVHMLTNEAFNALLKTLEEPPVHVVFVLCTTELAKVPETIRSRCQVFKFKRPDKFQIVERLKKIAQKEKILEKISHEEIEKIAILAQGAFRDAETLLQQYVEGGGLSFDFKDNVGYESFLTNLINGNLKECLSAIEKAYLQESNLDFWVYGLLLYLRDLIYINFGFDEEFFSLSREQFEERKKVASLASLDWLVLAVEVFNQARNDIKNYFLPQAAIEVAIAKLGFSGAGERDKNKDNWNKGGDESQQKTANIKESKEGKQLGESQSPKHTKDSQESKNSQALRDIENKAQRIKEAEQENEVNEASKVKEKEEGRKEETEAEEVIIEEIKEARGGKEDVFVSNNVSESYVLENWPKVMNEASKLNSSLSALLRSVKILGLKDGRVNLEVYYKFHKERLESAVYRNMIESIFVNVFGFKLGLNCVLSKRTNQEPKLTDINIKDVSEEEILMSGSVTDIFDGALPL